MAQDWVSFLEPSQIWGANKAAQRTNYGQSTQDFTYSTYCVPIHGFLP